MGLRMGQTRFNQMHPTNKLLWKRVLLKFVSEFVQKWQKLNDKSQHDWLSVTKLDMTTVLRFIPSLALLQASGSYKYRNRKKSFESKVNGPSSHISTANQFQARALWCPYLEVSGDAISCTTNFNIPPFKLSENMAFGCNLVLLAFPGWF